ncbi:hypothetical protein [Bradyrhizobium sp. 15]|uniref:hypothetical protein n=1 Tax=Bradyrhizobium sp. 15 TaxID=2782633 RepID=UPI001FF75124|nr:hypothetical protein [Bradyrhizobium sp. 15]MCK1434941.1 hypothetical protein [Bradyrhizobium sp. 15]
MYDLHLVFTIILFLTATCLYLASGRASVFHPGTYYLFFHGLVFVVRPTIKYLYDFKLVYSLYRFWPTEEIQNLALFAANIGLVTFMSGVMLFGGGKLRFPIATTINATHRLSLLIASALCFPLIAISTYGALNRSTDFEQTGMIRDFSTMTAINTNSVGYLVDANQMMGPVSVLIAWIFRFRPIALFPFAAFVLFRMYVGSGRWTFLMAAASLALLYFYDTKRKWPTVGVIVTAGCLLVSFHLIGQSRSFLRDMISGQQSTQRSADTASGDAARNPLDNMDFANLEYLEYILTIVPDRTGTYDYFLRNLQIFTEPIPRALWPGKPVGPPIQLYNIFQYGFPIGITWTLVGEGWQDLGLLGIVIWCALAAKLLGALYNWFVQSDQSIFKVAIFSILMPLSVQWFRDGIILTVFKFPLFFVFPIAVWYVIYSFMAQRLAQRQRSQFS